MAGGLRGYRRWLFAYPKGYRSARGDEIAAVLAETGVSWREAIGLVRGGLRARLGRPASRSVVFWAIAATVVCGLFGAAFATRAAWETARPLPEPGVARAMFDEALPGQDWTMADRTPGTFFVFYGAPLRWSVVGQLLLGDGGEYEPAGVAGWVEHGPQGQTQALVDAAAAGLSAHGWTVYGVRWANMYDCIGPPCDPARIPRSATLTARRGDDVLALEVSGDPTSGQYLSAGLTRAAPAAVWPAGIAGGLAAGLAAFLLFGWASRRTEGRPVAGRLGRTVFAAAMGLWWTPILYAFPFLVVHHLGEPHPSWHPMWEWLGQPVFSLFFIAGGGCALLGLLLALAQGDELEPASPARTTSPAGTA